MDWFETASRLAGQTSVLGTALIGAAGITGITPNGGTSGSNATLANMLIGFRDSAVLKAPYSSTVNIIQPVADYIALRVRSYASQSVDLQRWETAAGVAIATLDASGRFTSVNSVATGMSLTVQNNNNANAGAHAQIAAAVGGTSAGDPYINLSVSGSTSWSLGIDNSDSRKFKISQNGSLGTNDYFTMDLTGAVSLLGTSASRLEHRIFNSNLGGSAHLALKMETGFHVADTYMEFKNDNQSYSVGLTGTGHSLGGYLFAITTGANFGGTGVFTISSTPTIKLNTDTTVAGGNLSVDWTRVGNDVRTLIRNNDNTNTASHALAYMIAGGASGGDAYVRMDINGVTSWAMGVDNSDADKFKISKSGVLGTNDYLVIDTSGNVTLAASFTATVDYVQLPWRASDPAAGNGNMYFNTASGHIRGYAQGAWRDII